MCRDQLINLDPSVSALSFTSTKSQSAPEQPPRLPTKTPHKSTRTTPIGLVFSPLQPVSLAHPLTTALVP